MIYLRRPSEAVIGSCLSQQDAPFSYAEVRATATALTAPPASKYDLDRHEFTLGAGRDLYERARDALADWRHFEIPWLELHRAGTSVQAGQVVATLISLAGVWSLNPCRVVYTELSPSPDNTAAFAYGTLRGHVERGEERFAVSFDPESEQVRYEIVAFSRPAIPITRLASPLARRLQRRFAASSAEALAQAVA